MHVYKLLLKDVFWVMIVVMLLVFVLVSDVCVSRCNHTDQSEVQLIIQRLLAKVAHSARKNCYSMVQERFQIVGL